MNLGVESPGVSFCTSKRGKLILFQRLFFYPKRELVFRDRFLIEEEIIH